MKMYCPIRSLMDHQIFAMQAHGGISRIFVEIARHFPRDGMSLRVFGGLHVNEYFHAFRAEGSAKTSGIRVPRWIGRQRILLPVDKIILSLFCAIYRPSLIHYTYFHRTQPRRRNVREVMTVHDMIYEVFPEYFRKKDSTAEMKQKMASEVDGIICVSEKTREDMLRMYDIPAERVRVIYHGNPMEGVRARIPEGLPGNFLLYVGRREGYKNFQIVLSALAQTGRRDLHLVAFGGGRFLAEEVKAIEQLGLTGRVHQRGGDDAELAGCYERATALVYPSRYEGFGLPPLEAMSLGCPVITCRISSIPEVVGDAGLYFDPDDPGQLCGCIERLTDGAERQRCISKGAQQALKFSWTRCALETAGFYKHILSLPSRRTGK